MERVWEPRLFIRKQVTSKVTSEQQKKLIAKNAIKTLGWERTYR